MRPSKLKTTDCPKYFVLPNFFRCKYPMTPTAISKAKNAEANARTMEVSKLLYRSKKENAYPPRTPNTNPAINSRIMKPGCLNLLLV